MPAAACLKCCAQARARRPATVARHRKVSSVVSGGNDILLAMEAWVWDRAVPYPNHVETHNAGAGAAHRLGSRLRVRAPGAPSGSACAHLAVASSASW